MVAKPAKAVNKCAPSPHFLLSALGLYNVLDICFGEEKPDLFLYISFCFIVGIGVFYRHLLPELIEFFSDISLMC